MAHPVTDIGSRLPTSDSEPDSIEVVIPKRPAPTPEQARLGIMPAAAGSGRVTDVEAWMRTVPHFDGTDEEFREFEAAIAENRVMRRQLAREKDS